MIRSFSLLSTALFAFPAFAQSDLELLENVRDNAEQIYIEQVSFTLPEAFHKSGLAPSDKERLVKQWASDSANCHVSALKTYAANNDAVLSDIINEDGSYGFGVGVPADFELLLQSCLEQTWEAIGARFQ